ncbi:hypothetical protein OJ997_34030 [Solirubrobacter phytolaccae]|uniref:ABC transporter substrate-binding protein n=1 Tax=Solirubrobacter phytolaccae TaxID=1404360 RepID=A0A9X3SEW0_9ACTN|nr:hypothetical protein [Solirubrobacter phytolaccae]MDA0185375.1 hypothetical protein [Solirubrobacter phytolaccae]
MRTLLSILAAAVVMTAAAPAAHADRVVLSAGNVDVFAPVLDGGSSC